MPMGVPPAPVVRAGLPAFSWYLASALTDPISGQALKILAALAMGVITLPVPATPQVWAGPEPACRARLLLKTLLPAFVN